MCVMEMPLTQTFFVLLIFAFKYEGRSRISVGNSLATAITAALLCENIA